MKHDQIIRSFYTDCAKNSKLYNDSVDLIKICKFYLNGCISLFRN